MSQTTMWTMQLIPQQETKSRAAFSTEKEYEHFRRDFAESVRADLQRHRDARQKSEEAARQHRVH